MNLGCVFAIFNEFWITYKKEEWTFPNCWNMYIFSFSAGISVLIIQGDGDGHSQSRISGQQQYLKGKNRKSANVLLDRSDRYGADTVVLALSLAAS
jgi:hypothetical protein